MSTWCCLDGISLWITVRQVWPFLIADYVGINSLAHSLPEDVCWILPITSLVSCMKCMSVSSVLDCCKSMRESLFKQVKRFHPSNVTLPYVASTLYSWIRISIKNNCSFRSPLPAFIFLAYSSEPHSDQCYEGLQKPV